MIRVLFGLLLAAITAGAAAESAQAGRLGCRPVSADNPMTSSQQFGVATCGARGPRYFRDAFLGEGARGYVHRTSSSDDPMVWSDAQWRSDFFDGYVDTYNDTYDRRFRRQARVRPHAIVHRIERHIVTRDAPDMVVEGSVPQRRAKVLSMRTGKEVQPLENSSRFTGHRCSGVLVLTWKSGGARSRCHDDRSRLRRF